MGRSFFSDLSRRGRWLEPDEREVRLAELIRKLADDDIVVPEPCRRRFSDTSVAVVGGGLAGLSAALELASKGAIPTVFEARPFVGGRVLSRTKVGTHTVMGRIVEYGAELIGAIHPLWHRYAHQYKLGCIGCSDAQEHMKAGLESRLELDRRLTYEEQDKLAKDMERRIFIPIGRLANKIADPSRPWRQPGLKSFDSMSVGGLLRTLGITRGSRLWLAMEQLLVNNNVAPLDELNLLGLMCLVKGGQFTARDKKLLGYWYELEIFRASEGCQALAREMEKEFVTRWQGRVRTNTAVTKIDLAKRPELTWNEIDERCRVLRTGSGGFDFVVFAVPPTVWANVTITPVHPMDPGQVGIMNTGPAVKHFSVLPSRVWMETKAAPLGGALDLGQVWEGTDNQMRLPEQPLVLGVFAGGRIPSTFEPQLERLFPGYTAARPKTDLMDWPKTPFICCGYASPKKGQIFKVGKALNEPFGKRMVFAGEHTSMAFFGYMEGALQSGRNAARRVVKLACG
jgi:monoamine oxidase